MIPADWSLAAIDPPRAFGPPVGRARYRCSPEDFVVDEQLGFEPAGQGPHLLLRVRKRGANTDWVARDIARAVGCRPMDVGVAGMKDRHAVTTQWMTAPAGRLGPAELLALQGDGYQILEAHPHNRKLPRGALETNRFRLVLREFDGDAAALEARLGLLRERGVPNYFGPQRFGRELGNLRPFVPRPPPDEPRDADRADPRDSRRRPRLDPYAISAGRSLIFNAVLAARVVDGRWDKLIAGDFANLDGRGSVFPVEDAGDATLIARCLSLDIHPTGPLWGRRLQATDDTGALEADVAARFPDVCAGLEAAGADPSRRSLRLPVQGLEWTISGTQIELAFELRSGGYATTVLRELLDAVDAAVPGPRENTGGEDSGAEVSAG